MSIPYLINQPNMSQPQDLEMILIPYSVNQLVDLSLWDDSAHSISIYSLNKCLETDAHNITMLFNRIASFVRNRFLDGKIEKDILYILQVLAMPPRTLFHPSMNLNEIL